MSGLLILFMLFMILFVLVHIFKYIRYFTFLFHNEAYNQEKLTFSEFIKFMKKK